MTGRKVALCLMLCLLLPLLAGCVNSLPQEKASTGETLPDVRSGPEAPVGDSQMPREIQTTLYLPSVNTTRLNPMEATITVESGQTKQEACVEQLLELINGSDFPESGEKVQLLTVSNAVESTGELVTVNLHESTLSPAEQYALNLAIVNTLTELSGTNYVNILVGGRDIGLNMGETIPTGVMDRKPGNDVGTYWSQLQAEREATDGSLERNAVLYFVSEDGNSLLGEVRNITFSAYDTATYARELLGELAKGAALIDGARTVVPSWEWLERDPEVIVDDEGTHIELYFVENTTDFLSLRRSNEAMMLSSICYTLTSFIPRLDSIVAYINGELVTELTLMNGERWGMQSGQLTREAVASLAADMCTVYYPLADGSQLYAVTRPIAQRLRTQPRALLRELMRPPQRAGLTQAIPEEINEADILGLRIEGDTALLNVTEAFARACQGMTETQERNMIYAIVNTMTEVEGVTRVRFFVSGAQIPLAGHLFVGGEFMRHTGLIYAEVK